MNFKGGEQRSFHGTYYWRGRCEVASYTEDAAYFNVASGVNCTIVKLVLIFVADVVMYMYMCTTINPQQLKVTNTKSFQKDAATIIQYL